MNTLNSPMHDDDNLVIGNPEKSQIIVPSVALQIQNRENKSIYWIELEVNPSFYCQNEENQKLSILFFLYKNVWSKIDCIDFPSRDAYKHALANRSTFSMQNICHYLLSSIDFLEWDFSRQALADCLTRKIASQIIGFLPKLFENQIKAKRPQLENLYQGTSAWLTYWSGGQETYELKQSAYYWIENFALVARRRYELIYELFNRGLVDKNIFLTPEYAWLLSETCIFQRQLTGDHPSCKEHKYQNQKKRIDALNDISSDNNFEPRKFGKDGLKNHTDLYFDDLAHETAKNRKNSSFDEDIFMPYIAALYRENNYFRKNLELLLPNGLPPIRRGRRMGQKKPQY